MERKIVITDKDGLTTVRCSGIRYMHEFLGILRVVIVRKEEEIRIDQQRQNSSVYRKTKVRKKKRKSS